MLCSFFCTMFIYFLKECNQKFKTKLQQQNAFIKQSQGQRESSRAVLIHMSFFTLIVYLFIEVAIQLFQLLPRKQSGQRPRPRPPSPPPPPHEESSPRRQIHRSEKGMRGTIKNKTYRENDFCHLASTSVFSNQLILRIKRSIPKQNQIEETRSFSSQKPKRPLFPILKKHTI